MTWPTMSPIEQLFLDALLDYYSAADKSLDDGRLYFDGEWSLKAQHPVGPYRLDFAIEFPRPVVRLAVELDGHEFHERTKEQAARDKRRDRYLLKQGWLVLRFTGSEVFADPTKCVEEVMEFGGDVMVDLVNREIDACERMRSYKPQQIEAS